MQAQRFDGLIQEDLAAIDRKTTFRHDFGDVARRDRAVKLTGIAGLADGDEGFSFEFTRHALGFFLLLEVAGFELNAILFEPFAIVVCGAQGLALGQ